MAERSIIDQLDDAISALLAKREAAVNEADRVVAERKVRAQVDAGFELAERALFLATQPQRTSHRPVRPWIAVVRHEALSGRHIGPLDLGFPVGPSLKSILPVRE